MGIFRGYNQYEQTLGVLSCYEKGGIKLFYLLHDKKWAICHCLFSGQSLQKIRDTPPYGLANRVPSVFLKCLNLDYADTNNICPCFANVRPQNRFVYTTTQAKHRWITLSMESQHTVNMSENGVQYPSIHWLIIILLIITVKLPFSGVYTPFPDPISRPHFQTPFHPISIHFHSLNPCEWFKSC